MTTLVTFIGRGNSDLNGSGYRKTTYQLPDGTLSDPVSYVGKALINKLAPSRIVVVGTSGSMWDELCFNQVPDDFHLHLFERCSEQTLDKILLNELESAINQNSKVPYTLVLVPDAADEQDQAEFFSQFTSAIHHGESITLDITHGFRFMPILAFSSIQFLQFVKHVTVTNLLYALYIPNKKISSIYSLKQSIELGSWVNALSQYDHSGDLGVFADLLSNQGWPNNSINQLRKGAFFERTTNTHTAKAALTNVLNEPVRTTIGQLMSQELASRTAWVRQDDRSARECMLAMQYLKRHDYLRAVIYGFEGIISRYATSNDHRDREATKPILIDIYGDNFRKFRILRNNLVHGVYTTPTNNMSAKQKTMYQKVNNAITDSEKLPNLIESIFDSLGISN